jgi:hypothetical protein
MTPAIEQGAAPSRRRRRAGLRNLLLAALASGAYGLFVGLGGHDLEIARRLLVLVLGALAIDWLVAAFLAPAEAESADMSEDAAEDPRNNTPTQGRGRPTEINERLAAERLIRVAARSAGDSFYQLRPRLVSVAELVLAEHGVTLSSARHPSIAGTRREPTDTPGAVTQSDPVSQPDPVTELDAATERESLGRDHRAVALLGRAGFCLVDPDRPPPSDRREPGLSIAEVLDLLRTLEALQ